MICSSNRNIGNIMICQRFWGIFQHNMIKQGFLEPELEIALFSRFRKRIQLVCSWHVPALDGAWEIAGNPSQRALRIRSMKLVLVYTKSMSSCCAQAHLFARRDHPRGVATLSSVLSRDLSIMIDAWILVVELVQCVTSCTVTYCNYLSE
jgi:hypothetical protein